VQVVVVGRAYMIDDLRGGKTECSWKFTHGPVM
jgi:hypothetical protein